MKLARPPLLLTALACGIIVVGGLYFWPTHEQKVTSATCVGIMASGHTDLKALDDEVLGFEAKASCGLSPYYAGFPMHYHGHLAPASNSTKPAGGTVINEVYIVPLLTDLITWTAVAFVVLLLMRQLTRKTVHADTRH
jgi:hypothetical protein